MALTQAQILEIKKRAASQGISSEQVDAALPQILSDYEKRNSTALQPPIQTTTPGAGYNPPALPQQDGNFITKTAKAIVDPALKFGSFVGESVAQASRAVVDPIGDSEQINKQITDLSSKNKSLIDQAKKEKDPTKKQELLTQSRDISNQIAELGNQARDIGNKQQTFIMQDSNAIADRGKILETGAKRTAGAASYAIPGSIGTGATVAGTVARAAGAGAIAGGLQGFGNSEGKDLAGTVTDTTTGAVVGGATAGTFAAAGQAVKAVRESRVNSEIGKKLTNMGTDFKKSAYVKSVGRKPILREGGDKLLDKMMNAGIKPGNPEEVIYQADNILLDNAGAIFDKADEFSQKGVVIDKQKVLAPLEQKLKTAPAKSKPVIEKVLNYVKEDIDQFDSFTPAEAYAMKGDYGAFGNWNSTMDSDAVTEAKLWEDIYLNLNDLMDQSFKKNGYDDFRKVNELTSTAINAKKYAARAGNVAPNLNTLGLMDVLAGGAGLAAGGGTMGLAALAGKRVINSPQFASKVGGAFESVGAKLSSNSATSKQVGATIIGDTLSKLAQRSAVDLSTGSGELIQDPNKNSDPSADKEAFNQNNYQNDTFLQNNQDIVPQTAQHPIPKFREYASKDEMIQAAFAEGLGSQDVRELAKLWDEFAPTSTSASIPPQVQSLIEQRSLLTKAGLSTTKVDAQLSQYGYDLAPQGSDLSATTENRVQLAVSGLRYVNDIEKMIADDPQKIFLQSLPGQLGARDYDSAAFKAVEGLLRARSGAAIPPEEVRNYMKANLPRVGDSNETIDYKLRTFKQDLTDVANSGGSFNAQAVLNQ